MSMQVMGGGYELDEAYPNMDFSFLDIGNLHVMRDRLAPTTYVPLVLCTNEQSQVECESLNLSCLLLQYPYLIGVNVLLHHALCSQLDIYTFIEVNSTAHTLATFITFSMFHLLYISHFLLYLFSLLHYHTV